MMLADLMRKKCKGGAASGDAEALGTTSVQHIHGRNDHIAVCGFGPFEDFC